METDEFGFALHVDSSDDVEDDKEEDPEPPAISPSNIYAQESGSTQLYKLIRSGNQRRIVQLIDAYGEDFARVREHLERKYQWDRDDKIWLKKTILVACGEEQCQRVKSLENEVIELEDLRKAVFVLLQHPINGEEVAILHPSESNRLSVGQLIIHLIPNGFLTWRCIAAGQKNETFMEAAAACGLHEIIDKLYEQGDPIAIPQHNPLMQACGFDRKDTIQWLLTKHFDNFDCTLRDASQHNALIMALQRNDPKMLDLLLEKMIAYRCKHYQESESEAFNKIFRYESDESDASIFTFIWRSKSMHEVVEKAVIRYKLDLSYQYNNVSNIENLIDCEIAMEYCFEGIRQKPELLRLMTTRYCSILHEFIRKGFINFLREIYWNSPDVKRYFDSDAGYATLNTALMNENREAVAFILEHHREFLERDQRILRDSIVCRHYPKQYFDKRLELFKEFFPIYLDEIERIRTDSMAEQNSFENWQHDASTESDSIAMDSNDEPSLHQAVRKDDQDLFDQLLETGHDINTLDAAGNHSIHLVQSEAMLELIISRHPDGQSIVNRTNHDGFTLLHRICSLRMDHKTMSDLIERVIDCGANVHQLTKNGESIAFFVENCDVLEWLRKHNIQLDVVNQDRETALEKHLYNDNVRMARALLTLTYTLPTFKLHAHKYLDLMVKKGRYFFIHDYQDVLEKHPDMTKTIFDGLYRHSREEASRLFAKACRNEIYFIVEKFLDFDYNLNYNLVYKEDEYDDERTPLMRLISPRENYSNEHLIEKLLQKNVDVNVRNSSGYDALLDLALRYRFINWTEKGEKLVQLLMKCGASINSVDFNGNTALHWAFLSGRLELVVVLIGNGADFRIRNIVGNIPLQLANAVNRELFYFWS